MQKFQKSTLVAAMVISGVLGSAYAPSAVALGLGTAKVLSPIGQPLNAEIDITDMTADEAANLQVKIPGADAFKTAGVDYSRIAGDVQVSVQKRANGRSYLKLISNQTVTDPFLDLIVEASWGSGRVVRDYTLLLDPPSAANTSSVASSAKPATQDIQPVTPVARSVAPAPAPIARTTQRVQTVPADTPKVAKPAPRPAVAVPSPNVPSSGQTYTVQNGDTLTKIANQVKTDNVSLDQMLAALYQSNQDSFTNGNINRLQKGVVLQIPAKGAAGDISATDARRIVVAHSQDFSNYRAKLAKAVGDKPATVADSAQRSAAGKVETKVQDSKAPTAQPDKLTLSKGQVAGKADTQTAQADQVAKSREAKAAQDRMSEINRNVSELSKIAAASAPAASAAASKPATTTPGVAVTAKPPVVTPPVVAASAAASAAKAIDPVAKAVAVASAPATTASVAATAAASASAPTQAAPVASAPVVVKTETPASAPVAVASAAEASPAVAVASAPAAAASVATATPAVKKPVPAPEPEPSFIESITNNDLFLPGVGLLAVGLAGLGVWRLRKGKSSGDSSAFDSQVQGADSFFGGTGGARVDTRDSVLASSMYSSSQLNANEVDPVAEADVYLAYGRDLQAEEILKEALRNQPDRHSIRVKLLEIYAKRRDARSFEVVATELFSMTQGQGEDWVRAVELGRELEPTNALYNTQAGSSQLLTSSSSDFSPSGSPFDSPTTMPQSRAMSSGFAPTDVTAARTTQAPLMEGGLDLDLDLGGLSTGGESMVAPTPAPAADDNTMSFDMPSSLMAPKTTPTPAPSSAAEFDMSGINLDLADTGSGDVPDDPYDTKFALAEECQRLGDKDSARSILHEIVDMAKGAVRSKAEKMLGDLR